MSAADSGLPARARPRIGIAWILAPLPFVVWPAVRLAQGSLRWDFIALIVVAPALAYTAATRKLFTALYPMGLVGMLYDNMRLVKDVGLNPARVHLCDLRELEARFFGLTIGGRRVTLHDWLQAHASLPLDVYFSIPYATFLFAMVGFAFLLWRRDLRAVQRFAWCFLVMNVAGFITYHLYPAAPPWYFHAHGCTVDLAARASEGPNLARVDAWLGVSYFRAMYARSSDVFGAVPSLHVAYPLVIVLEGWRHLGRIGRGLALLFFVSMCGAAVYLDHHWVIDVVIGLVYGALTVWIVRTGFARLDRKGSVASASVVTEGAS